jgi:hypothetical protein
MTAETNTATVNRRPLQFASLVELLSELDRVEAAEKAGTLAPGLGRPRFSAKTGGERPAADIP